MTTNEALEWFNRRIEYFAVKHPDEIKHVRTIQAALTAAPVAEAHACPYGLTCSGDGWDCVGGGLCPDEPACRRCGGKGYWFGGADGATEYKCDPCPAPLSETHVLVPREPSEEILAAMGETVGAPSYLHKYGAKFYKSMIEAAKKDGE